MSSSEPEDSTVDSVDPIHEPNNGSTFTYFLHFDSVATLDQTLGCKLSIETKARADIRNRNTEAIGTRDLYFRTGRFSILGENGYKETHALTSLEGLESICKALTHNPRSPKNFKACGFEISQDYFALQTQVLSGEPFANTVGNEIIRLMKQSDDRLYMPRSVLNVLTSSSIVRRIIFEDADLSMTSDEKESLVQRVEIGARRLLLMCVDARLGMKCLQKLLDNRLSDEDLPLSHRRRPCHKQCIPQFRNLIRGQSSFMAAEFLKIGQNQEFSSHVVLPIYYKDVKTHRTDKKKASNQNSASQCNDNHGDARRKGWCGSGAYSNVYRVNIDPDHHSLSEDRDSDFAIKEFKDLPQRGNSDFNRELRVLEELHHYPNKNIVTHLATWTQNERYYMLFPYAECNLRQYMEHEAFARPDKENLLWLLKQFRGLANAIKTVHNLPEIETPKSKSKLAIPSSAQEKKSGWHHDLKPENILYFKGKNAKRGTFRIADFGTGKIYTYRSGSVDTKSPNGTLAYEPPEAATSGGATSRPYDLWSLGCVFLELLIWAVFDPHAVKTFAKERFGRRYPGSMTDFWKADGFWQMAEDGRVSLRQPVIQWIELLRAKFLHPNWHPFREVLDLVSRMLDPDRLKRVSALDLWNTLDRIYKQKKSDLKTSDRNRVRVNDSSLPKFSRERTPSLSLSRLSLKVPDRSSSELTLDTCAYSQNIETRLLECTMEVESPSALGQDSWLSSQFDFSADSISTYPTVFHDSSLNEDSLPKVSRERTPSLSLSRLSLKVPDRPSSELTLDTCAYSQNIDTRLLESMIEVGSSSALLQERCPSHQSDFSADSPLSIIRDASPLGEDSEYIVISKQ